MMQSNSSEPSTPSENKPSLSLAWVPEPGSFEGTALLHVAVRFGPGPGDDNSLRRRQHLSARLSAHLYIISLLWRRGNSGPDSLCHLPKVVPWETESSVGKVPVTA